MSHPPPPAVSQPEPGLRVVLASNPSPMTYWGTNTYILGTGQVAVVDPGPADPAHLTAILGALKPGEIVSHIFVSHTHLDHSPLARPLAQRTGAPVLAFGGAIAGRSPIMEQLATSGLVGGGEGIDQDFAPDDSLADGDHIIADTWNLKAIWTPGHVANHLCFSWGDRLFSGDHVMGWASSLVSPPDGDLTQFMASLHKLSPLQHRVFYPGHGPVVAEPQSRINWLINHRTGRETSILNALSQSPSTVAKLTRHIYHDLDPALIPAAQRNVFAHLIDLVQREVVSPQGTLSSNVTFESKN